MGIPIVIDALSIVTKELIQGLEPLKISGGHLNYSIVEIDQNSKSPGDLKIFALEENPVKNHQLTLE